MKKVIKGALILAATLSGSAFAVPTLDLDGTIRDMSSSHPDFESFCCGVVTGMVGTTLGGDGTPTFVGGAHMSTADNFYDWYSSGGSDGRDDFGELGHSITLSDPDSDGIFTYSSSSFFPIDGLLGGNQGLSHNYHFTYRITDYVFTYTGGEIFTFTGDDDLWVFINDERVIDLGGVHGPATSSVSLDTLGLTLGEDYNFDLFFAERHTVGSNFSIETSLQLRTTKIPEPSALVLMAFGLISLSYLRKMSV